MKWNGLGDELLQLLTPRGPRSLGPVWRYGLAVLIVVVDAALGRQLSPGMGATCPYNLTLIGVVVTTALLGTGPGIVAVILGVLGPELFVMRAMPMAAGETTLLRLGVALATGGSVVGLFHAFEVLQARLVESESTLRSFYESAPLLMGVVEVPADNSDIIHIYDNPATDRFFGRPGGSTVGQSARAIGAPEEAVRRWIEQYRVAEREGRPVQFEYWHPRESGAVWLSAAVAKIGVGDAGRTRFSYVVADLTERKLAEAALRESEEQFRATFNVSSVGKGQADAATGRFLRLNAAFCRMTGYSEAELLTRTIADITHPDDREKDRVAYSRLVSGHDSGYETEKRYVRKDGRVIWVHVFANLIRGAQDRPSRLAAVIQDITERKAFQAELERLVAERTAKLQDLVGELEHFSYTITHDLKAPLRAMRSFAEIASVACGDSGREEAKEALGRISRSADRMENLITDTLNYSQALQQELPLTDVDTGVLLRGMLESYPELQPSSVHIQVEGELPLVLGNEAGLTQCFSNLLGNAVKFVRPGEKPQIRVWAEVVQSPKSKVQSPGSKVQSQQPAGTEHATRNTQQSTTPALHHSSPAWVRICVEDKGIGISKGMLPRVFEVFSRGSKDYEGTGIGLALVRKMTQRMGGRAGVESEEGKGSRFWIELKAGKVRAKPEAVMVALAEPKGGTVLYVEDEENDVFLMRRAFAAKGLESALQVVGDGRTAIEYLSGAGKYADRMEYPLPSVVLLDLNLPQLPGFEVLKWMRDHADFARTPVVVFSSSTREDDRVKAQELRASEFVSKPGSGLEFEEVVEGLRARWMGAVEGSGERVKPV